MPLYLAADAGGTRTTFLLADEHGPLARAVTGTIKRLRTDAATAARHLDQALAELAASSGRELSAVTTTCVGAAGSTVPVVAEWLQEAFAARVGGGLLLLGDVVLERFFTHRKRVLAGTGSNVAGRLVSGEITTAGGWGPVLADQGSGHSIGRAGLRAAVLERDERGSSALLETIQAFWQLDGFQQLVAFSNGQPAPDLSQLAPLVAAQAGSGDPVAARVLEAEAADLAQLAQLVLERVHQTTVSGTRLRLAFAGSVLEHIVPMRLAIVAALQRRFGELEVVPGVVEPILGALWRARRAVKPDGGPEGDTY